MTFSARQMVERHLGNGTLAAWGRTIAGVLSGLLIVGAIVTIFLAGFFQFAPPDERPVTGPAATLSQRAPQLPFSSACQRTHSHRCGGGGAAGQHPTPAPAQPTSG